MDAIIDFLVRHRDELAVIMLGICALCLTRALLNLMRARASTWMETHHLYSIQEVSGLSSINMRTADRPRASRRPSMLYVVVLLGLGALLSLGVSSAWSRLFGSELLPSTVALNPPTLQQRAAGNKKLLVLIHGWNGDPADTWKHFPQLLAKDATLSDFDIWPIAYPTYQLRRNLSVRQMSRWLNEQMNRDGYYQRYDSIYVIAHSMGGLVARGMLLENRLARDNHQYKSLVEIATPHQGADVAALLADIGLSKGFSDDLRPDSPMLAALQDDWNALKDRPRSYCLTSPQDRVVSQNSAIFQCDEFLRYPQWGHTDMVKPTSQDDERYRVPVGRLQAAP